MSLIEEADLVGARMGPEAFEGLGLDLPHTLSRHSEFPPDLLKRMDIAPIQPESHDDDLPLARRQEVEHLVEVLLEQLKIRRRVGRQIFVVHHEISERRILFSSDRRIEREDVLGDPHDLPHLPDVHLKLHRKLLHQRLPRKLLGQSAVGMGESVDGFDHVDGDTDGPCLIGDRPSDPLAYPPGGVRGEFESLLGVELIDGAEKSYVSFLDEVEQSKPASHVLFRNADHEPEIRLRKPFP